MVNTEPVEKNMATVTAGQNLDQVNYVTYGGIKLITALRMHYVI